jgi:hypothetical protein
VKKFQFSHFFPHLYKDRNAAICVVEGNIDGPNSLTARIIKIIFKRH